MKVAYFGFPHVGGTFEVFRHLCEGLAPRGIEVRWVGIGRGAHRSLSEARWQGEHTRGFVVGNPDDGEAALGRELARALSSAGFDAVFVNVLGDAVQTNVARYLPPAILRILIVHNITPATYDAARAVRDHVHATVAISPRIRADLLRCHRFLPCRVELIPHAADLQAAPPRDEGMASSPLRLLFLGRVEDKSKGVLILPDILARLPAKVTLTVAGDGPDLPRLKRHSRFLGDRVRFLGAVDHEAVPSLLARHHVMLMPSRFEGFGLSLIEAMAGGCVPVVSRIHGVTDWLVEDGRNGKLFAMGEAAEAASVIGRLDQDRALLGSMSAAGREFARTSFSRETMAARHAALLERISADPPPVAAPLDLTRWGMPSGLRDSLRTHIPTPVKNLLRRIHENRAA